MMIKKGIALVLIVLLLVWQIGCTSYQKVLLTTDADQEKVLTPDEETLNSSEKVKITTMDDSTYTFTKVKIQGLEFKGTEWISRSKFREVVISAQEIKKIEIAQFDTGSTLVLTGVILLTPFIILSILIPEGGFK